MVPLGTAPQADLAGKRVLVLSGAMDPIVPADNVAHLVSMLETLGADVQHKTLPVGHGLSHADVSLTQSWLNSL